jgi:predicted nuclease with RNAse H fold
MRSGTKRSKKKYSLREQILKSLMASFKIEGIDIPLNVAEHALKKVERDLEKYT